MFQGWLFFVSGGMPLARISWSPGGNTLGVQAVSAMVASPKGMDDCDKGTQLLRQVGRVQRQREEGLLPTR